MAADGKRRAPGMSPEQRRDMIVQTALPLVAEHGYGVATRQIARAAGIGEATIFRVFNDKDSLLRACVTEALRPDQLLRELGSISPQTPLPERLTDAAEALAAHLGRMGAVVDALHASGMPLRPDEAHSDGGRGADGQALLDEDGRAAAKAATEAAIVELLEPDAERFRLPLETLASTFGFLAMAYGRERGEQEPPLSDSAAIVDLFLHGALLPGGELR